MRARDELVEIRAADLRFTPDEAAAYLNGMMGLQLTAWDVAALEARTEGWIAALQLAALSMQGREDNAGFIAGFTGDDRFIVDYLVEEVLQRQPKHVRGFLLRTSILSRLNGSLCDAVTSQDGGKAMLETLDRGNLFLVPLDDRRQWYRYHHLFADVLQARLLDEQPRHVHELHQRASEWYEQNGEMPEAIRHAMAGEDFERAADLVELAMPALRQGRQDATLRRWLEALPDELFQVRPVLTMGYVGALMARGEIKGVEARLRDVERGCPRRQRSLTDLKPRRRRWSSWTKRHFAIYRARSLCTVPDSLWFPAMCPPLSPMPGGRSTPPVKTIISDVERQPPSWASRTGRRGISKRRTVGMPMAWRVWRRPGTLPT